jgi:hypothetical protein
LPQALNASYFVEQGVLAHAVPSAISDVDRARCFNHAYDRWREMRTHGGVDRGGEKGTSIVDEVILLCFDCGSPRLNEAAPISATFSVLFGRHVLTPLFELCSRSVLGYLLPLAKDIGRVEGRVVIDEFGAVLTQPDAVLL